jgi:hypothetical protein
LVNLLVVFWSVLTFYRLYLLARRALAAASVSVYSYIKPIIAVLVGWHDFFGETLNAAISL